MKTDILIVGSGCAGLYAAIHLPKDKKITIITKKHVEDSDSYLAQGGICMLKDEEDYDSYFEDTLKAGHYENDKTSVDIMIRSSKDVIKDLLSYGVRFHRDENGELDFTKEGAHSNKRILFHQDITGEEITSHLYEKVKTLPNVTILEDTALIDLIVKDNTCFGGIILKDNKLSKISSHTTFLATGGVGGLYRHSTNFKHLKGDGVAIALKHGIKIKDINYVQIHPTTFYSDKEDVRSFLISESVRGEGAKLYDKHGNRFVNELLPRDKLSEAIKMQMEKDHTPFVWEDLRTIPEEEVRAHFPHIVDYCKEQGYDVFKQPIPVVPAQHYYMGGIAVDYMSHTSMNQLYAIGETACNGVHGKNRLASNSLLESLVFAKRAALDYVNRNHNEDDEFVNNYSLDEYNDLREIEKEYKKLILTAMKKAGEEHV